MMKYPFPPTDRKGFDVAIICALQLEADAVESIFDRFWDEDGDRYGKAAGDKNAYRTGVIGNHNVVLAFMPGMGKVHAASVAISCYSSFQGIRLALIVGICGGVPQGTEDGIFLGDIVISDEILMYDFGKMYPGGFQRKETVARSAVDSEVLAFLRKLKSPKGRQSLLGRTNHHLTVLQTQSDDYHCPGRRLDQLFEPTYHHKHRGTSKCKKCKKGEPCKKAQESTCEELQCNPKKLKHRSRKNPSGINIHFGRIASGDMVMKSGVDRDRIAAEEDVIAFEMEGAGVCGSMPFIVIKGVCDYADSHKDKIWQKHTAGAAAACMRSLLEQWAAIDHAEQRRIHIKDLLDGEPEPSIKTPSEIQSTRGDEGYHSQNSYDSSDGEITQVLSRIESCFKSTLAYFKQYRKFLPRDIDLKRTFKTQRVIFAGNVKSLSSDAPDSVNDYLGSSKKVCLQAALEIERKLEHIQGLTKHLPAPTKAREQSKSATETLKHAVEDLKSLIQVFASSIPQTNQPLPWVEPNKAETTRSRREFQHFHIVQQAANSLYDALGTACNLHTIHDVHLSLQPDLDRTSTRVRFDVAFSQHSMPLGTAVWINVESTIKSVETSSDPGCTSTTTSMTPLKRQSSQKEQKPSSTMVRKTVQFHLQSGPALSLHPVQLTAAIPNLYLQRNFCTVVERSLHKRICNGCIGLLGDNESCKHLAYLGRQTESSTTPTSLSQLVSLSKANPMKEMGTYERVRLARYLATAVLYYHATPWLRKAWSSNDVYFFDNHDASLQQERQRIPYMTASIHASSSSTQSQSRLSDYHHIIRNPVLFGLGVMFLELAFQAPLGALQHPVDLEKGETWGFVEYFTAHRVVEQSHSKVSTSFKKIIKQCLHCDFGHDSDFTSPALQQAFHKDVIAVLEDLEEVFRDLQLE